MPKPIFCGTPPWPDCPPQPAATPQDERIVIRIPPSLRAKLTDEQLDAAEAALTIPD